MLDRWVEGGAGFYLLRGCSARMKGKKLDCLEIKGVNGEEESRNCVWVEGLSPPRSGPLGFPFIPPPDRHCARECQ